MASGLRRAAALLLSHAAVYAGAATYNVDRYADVPTATACLDAVPLDCSLRGAVIKANGTAAADLIQLGKGTYALTVPGADENSAATGDLDLHEDVTIAGQGAGITIIRAEVPDRVFEVYLGVDAVFRRLTITNGSALGQFGYGGGIHSLGTSVTVVQCEVLDNVAGEYGGGIGVAISNGTSLTILESIVSGNLSDFGGGIYIAGYEIGTNLLTIEDSTLAANTAASYGGALLAGKVDGSVRNSTFSGNVNGEGSNSGVTLYSSSVVFDSSTLADGLGYPLHLWESTVVLRNTLIAGSCTQDVDSAILSQGGNLESPGATCNLGASDLENVADPGLEPLGKYGSSTLTHRLKSWSPAVDAELADANCEPHDQRGIARPQAAGSPGPAHCDIGAYERVNRELFLDGFEGGTWWGWSQWSQ